jgi:hypothetical protein
MTEVSRVTAQNAEMHRQIEIKKLDHRHEELRLEAMRVKERLKENEDKRMEMNRPGQNIDRMA